MNRDQLVDTIRSSSDHTDDAQPPFAQSSTRASPAESGAEHDKQRILRKCMNRGVQQVVKTLGAAAGQRRRLNNDDVRWTTFFLSAVRGQEEGTFDRAVWMEEGEETQKVIALHLRERRKP